LWETRGNTEVAARAVKFQEKDGKNRGVELTQGAESRMIRCSAWKMAVVGVSTQEARFAAGTNRVFGTFVGLFRGT